MSQLVLVQLIVRDHLPIKTTYSGPEVVAITGFTVLPITHALLSTWELLFPRERICYLECNIPRVKQTSKNQHIETRKTWKIHIKSNISLCMH